MQEPSVRIVIGVNALPDSIRHSRILTNSDLVELGSVQDIPDVDASFDDDTLKNIFLYYSVNPEEMENELHIYAKELLAKGKLREAWQVLLTLNV
jgi:hypothetical protein